jgi:hypothetical protein
VNRLCIGAVPSASTLPWANAFRSVPEGHAFSQVRGDPPVVRFVIRLLSTG